MTPRPYISHFLSTLNRLLKLRSRIGGRAYTPSEFTSVVRRQFDAVTFTVKTQKDSAVDPDSVIVAGLYDPHDYSEMLPSITLTLCYHPDQSKYFVDLLNWDQFAFDVAECIGHEMVHMDQHLSGRHKTLKEYVASEATVDQDYLGDEGEIEAYGFSIAAEMKTFNKPMHECVMYGVYQETFTNDPQIVLQLETQVKQHYKKLEELYEQTN